MTFVIGIAGGTGSGKTTIARAIAGALPREHVAMLEHDWYYRHRPELPPDERALSNFDHPDSLETSLLVEHVSALRQGKAVDAPVYDFKTHARLAETHRVDPKPVIIVEGILVFVDAQLRELMNVKIFVDTDADIRLMRRIRRDIEQRGRTFQSIREQYYKTVRPMHLAFVEPSKRWADVLIPEGGDNAVALDLVTSRLREVISQATR
ncbi:MAG TPA: uridine kinase [Myxococcota bacterium]